MTALPQLPKRAGLTVALGAQIYSVERPWGNFPAGHGTVSDVAVDNRGHVFVLLRRDSLAELPGPAVVELSPSGSTISMWGEDLIADGHKLAFSPDGRLFIVDRDAHQILICTPYGRLLDALGVRNGPNAPFNHPCGVAFGADGEIYVCDGYASSRIHCFSPEGKLIHSWGSRGTGPGQFVAPHAIAVLPGGRIVVGDRDNHRLQVFSADGALLDIWTGFHRPADLCVDGAGLLYVIDQVPSLTLLSTSGDDLGRCRPVLNSAHGIALDSQSGKIYLAEPNPSRISVLVPRPLASTRSNPRWEPNQPHRV